MITDDKKKSVVDSILQSKDFKDSPINQKLLSYLVDATLSDNIPKEITVAMDVFEKDTRFNSNKDSTVRYHVHALRNKLDRYYKNEGKNEKIRVVIPKGHYEIKFVTANADCFRDSGNTLSFLKRWEIVTILLLILMNIFLVYRQIHLDQLVTTDKSPKFVDPADKIWNPFFQNGYPVAVVIGDDFFMDEYCPEFDRYRIVRDWEIDSEEEMSGFLARHPRTNLWKSEITGIPFGGASNLMDILPIIYRFQDDVSLHMSSTLSLADIQNHNVIYVGEFKNLRILNQIIYKTPIRYQYHPDERLYIVQNGDTMKTCIRIEAPYEQQDKYNVDYSLLMKLPGFSGENLMFIAGFGYGGRIERTKMLSNPEMRSKFIEEIQSVNTNVPEYFIALFEVKSIERTGFANKLAYFQEIPGDFFE